MMKWKLLIVDDEKNMCHMLEAMLERYGYCIAVAYDGRDALAFVKKEHFDFILCDVKMPHVDGMMFLQKGAQYLKASTVVMMSAYGTIDLAIAAMKIGAYDFISKPFKSDEVLLALKKAEEREQLKRENRRLKHEIHDIKNDCNFTRMVSISSKMKDIFSIVRKVAQYDTTVLICGESGTGKELIARGVHEYSGRCENAFVAVNCGSIPENLLESELFGHRKGAFTGAVRDKKGIFEEADGGTLFLDEIGDLPLSMQVKLLRVLQEQEIRPLGGVNTRAIDVRVVTATAKDLAQQVEMKCFREDLFYRLNVVPILLPALRDRTEDIPLLVKHFVTKNNNRFATDVQGFSPAAMNCLLEYSWPGNVRELENMVQRCMVLTTSVKVVPEDLPTNICATVNKSGLTIDGNCLKKLEGDLSLKKARRKLEASLIASALKKTGMNKSKAAGLLDISYPSLLTKIKEYAIVAEHLAQKCHNCKKI